MSPDDRADRLAAVFVELAVERFGPVRLPAPDEAAVIAARRRILLGCDEPPPAVRRDRRLAAAIRKWSA